MNTTLNLFYPESLSERIGELLSSCSLSNQKKLVFNYLARNPGACTDEIIAACDAIDPCRRIRELNVDLLPEYGLIIKGRLATHTRLSKFGQHKRAHSWQIMRLEDV
ncbi:hypothetical protein E2F43_05250 [Seongchinamella unica]|uniref:Uncharacterized protein n=1 Tax=Seongchinamella unica TaxID=2547392 RepID=A0A4R5LW22_9GAMM|nr:hypothetical protein [Seongchinamella unica]TDG15632.1 hypothetical protein E2F43_05250 [Seongchinamella unica]